MTLDLHHDLRMPRDRHTVSRQAFVAELRGFILNDMAAGMRDSFERDTAPAFVKQHGRPPATQDEVHDAMRSNTYFRFYSAIRCNAQEMVWRSVIPDVQLRLGELKEKIAVLSGKAGGTLTLDPSLPLPKNVEGLEVHLMPGGYAPDDTVAAGAVYDNGLCVFAAGFMGRNLDDIGLSMSNYVKHGYPDFAVKRVLDCGATVGHNAAAWAQTFPGAEVHAIDVSAAVLQYGHGRAESLGLPVHFRQMNATDLKYPDGSFDVVFTSMFLHELSVPDIRKFFAEARRVLRPGGLLINMELPPNGELPPYEQFYLDWDCYYNKEPFYRAYRDQEPAALVATAGFDPGKYFQFVIPQYSYMPETEFISQIRTPHAVNQNTGRLSSGVQWFGFGAWKQ